MNNKGRIVVFISMMTAVMIVLITLVTVSYTHLTLPTNSRV